MIRKGHNETAQDSMLRPKVEEAIKTARLRLMKHDEYLGGDETRTRVVIIDEVLKGLGWMVTDPEQVRLEHRDNGNKMDYVLMKEGERSLAVVEAKRSRDALTDEHRRQASGYATEPGANYAALTNGARWEAWKMNTGKPRRESMIVEASITTGDIEEIASQLMSIHSEALGTDEE